VVLTKHFAVIAIFLNVMSLMVSFNADLSN
jgi:hypothetical protein